MLKHSEKKLFSMAALSEFLLAVQPFLTKAGIDGLFLYNILFIFQNCFAFEGLNLLKNWALDLRNSLTTLILCVV